MNRIVISADLCMGNGRCYTIAPGLISDDDRGYGTVIGDGVLEIDALEAANRAVRACPEGAIEIVEEVP